ncbi:thiolase family protein [Mycobacterium xenopi]|uniref:Thiolase C-terminal domain-containing protein n=1 Tax=Mycobacterium xenopi TaxID=1789 RepID=A0AAD1H2U0_MYCXE|nr:thiolase family protein [Mycobacterium xenopi]MDA3641360.1 thiolase family protein [Mycobacterium xenopi]MDA3659295.1 thiolase family protein [Mycobacterium xenopi]MDA3663624.1 thiolase family protein [Mycobacterium xenopi]ORX19375.1 acetyl-CoA acetyltransferase [Mycobacterium xenopi]SPX89322.1 ditF protein [Mycobacterium xenopi]
MRYFEKDAILSGVGISRIGRRTGIPGLELTLEAVRDAIADAGLAVSEVDGIATLGDTPPDEVSAELGIQPADCGTGFDTGGLLSPVMSACLAVAEKRARHVLVYRTVQMIGGTVPTSPSSANAPRPALARIVESPADGDRPAIGPMDDVAELVAAHAYSAANWLALNCRRHMQLYGTTKEQLGWLAINSRRNAALNPLAVYREPLTMAEYLAARPVSSPFGLLDCDVPVDGSIAVVVSAAGYARDCPHRPVAVEAIGGSNGAGGWFHREDYPKMASVDAAAQLWSRTDLRPADVDIAELYDGFTFLTFAWLEALGICDDGEAGPFVEGATRIALDGVLPLNTYGGQLSAGRMHGYWVLHEACLQLRGDAGQRQVSPRPEVAAVAVGGGPIAGCILLTS